MRARTGGSTKRAGGALFVTLLAACGQAKPPPPSAPAPGYAAPDAGALLTPSVSMPPLDAAPDGTRETTGEPDGGAVVSLTDAAPQGAEDGGACPAGMKLVDASYCPHMERTCLDEEYSPQNHIVICHRFSEKQHCVGREEHRRFCIDEYEYPNRAGAHPPWMVSWFDAEATCEAGGKRLCFESEWVTACEGPDKSPFPYGFSRDNGKCNIDNAWIQPSL